MSKAADRKICRRNHPDYITRNLALGKARRDAYQRLAMRHPQEFYDIYWQICASRDLKPSEAMKIDQYVVKEGES